MPTDSTIKIKRATGTTAPTNTQIVQGELATTMDSSNNGAGNRVYLGIQNSTAGTNVVEIGGKYYTDAIANLAYFKNVAVASQSTVVADTSISGSTLTLAAGSGIQITTNASTDTVTIASTLGGGTVTSITPAADTGTGTAITSSGSITVAGTANEVETSVSGTTITVGLPNNVTVGGNLTVSGNLTINGTTTTVNSTTVTIDDPVFTLGGDTAPSSDDNLDRGIEFRWHDGLTAALGFMGWDDSRGTFAIWGKATNSSGVYSTATTGGRGSLDLGSNIRAYSNAASESFYTDLAFTSASAVKTVTVPNATGTVLIYGTDENTSNITTLGTISSGTWNAGVIAGQYGGTGVNNTSKTITLGGNLTTSGAFALTLTQTATTNVTLPTTGTLATLAGTETFTNKTINGATLSGSINATNATNLIIPVAAGKTVSTSGEIAMNSTTGTMLFYDVALSTQRTVVSTDQNQTLLNKTLTSPTLTTPAVGGGGMTFAGSTSGTVTVVSTASAGGTLTLPNTTGTVITTGNSTSITSVGTIATGVWQGTLIGSTYGGTGVNNGSATLTMAGNVTHSGAFTQTFTATANTSVTLPTSGTLATLAGTETFTNKTIDGGSWP